jgi:DNA-binding SARP family transcriptional activator
MTAGHPAAFRLLGAIELETEGARLDLGADQDQRLLVALLAAKGMPVSRDRLMDIIWDGVPPTAASSALHQLVRALRRRLELAGLNDALPRSANGTYRLDVPAAQVDLHQFHACTSRARELVYHDDQLAAEALDQALRLCRGEPLAGLTGSRIDAYRHTLTEEYRSAELTYHEVALRLGKHQEQIASLSRLFRDRPGDEWVAWLYMHALYRSGRQEEAFAAYQKVRSHLGRTTATGSLPVLTDLYERMLRGDAGVLRPEAMRFAVTDSAPRVPGPTPHAPGPGQATVGIQHQERDGDTSMTWEQFTNSAHGHAHVGMQVGKVNGSVHHGSGQRASARTGMHDGLRELQQTLAASLRRNELDPAVVAAAERELDEAASHLAQRGEAWRQGLVIALERLHNLLADKSTEVAIKVAMLIDLAEDMS